MRGVSNTKPSPLPYREVTAPRFHKYGLPRKKGQLGWTFDKRRDGGTQRNTGSPTRQIQNTAATNSGGTANRARGTFDFPHRIYRKRKQCDIIRSTLPICGRVNQTTANKASTAATASA